MPIVPSKYYGRKLGTNRYTTRRTGLPAPGGMGGGMGRITAGGVIKTASKMLTNAILSKRRKSTGKSTGSTVGTYRKRRYRKKKNQYKLSLGALKKRVMVTVNCIFKYRGIHQGRNVGMMDHNLYQNSYRQVDIPTVEPAQSITTIEVGSSLCFTGGIGHKYYTSSNIQNSVATTHFVFGAGNQYCIDLALPTGAMNLWPADMRYGSTVRIKQFGMQENDQMGKDVWTGLTNDSDIAGAALLGTRLLLNTKYIRNFYVFKYKYTFDFFNLHNEPHTVVMLKWTPVEDMTQEATNYNGMSNWLNWYIQGDGKKGTYDSYVRAEKFPKWMKVLRLRKIVLGGVQNNGGSSTGADQTWHCQDNQRSNHRRIVITSKANFLKNFTRTTNENPGTNVVITQRDQRFDDRKDNATYMNVWAYPNILSNQRGIVTTSTLGTANDDTIQGHGWVRTQVLKETLYGVTQDSVIF